MSLFAKHIDPSELPTREDAQRGFREYLGAPTYGGWQVVVRRVAEYVCEHGRRPVFVDVGCPRCAGLAGELTPGVASGSSAEPDCG